ncbi:unnamed protein product [Didymodactylos carnosus]|uniref:TLDc domain-containing protein n=1 Tax=Didymodactylos carnosus TaxID=1234261 RepID=A0A814UTW5_9BILA|nr:unnamed protein product [Didymodactylos carnosus]CAF3942998.1 unnamed protein product [Didymodactylos carnosus]
MTTNTVKTRLCCICVSKTNGASETKDTTGVNICGGCEKRFCNKHYKVHREEIDRQFDDVCVEHGSLLENLNTRLSAKSSASSLIQKILEWENETIDKVRETAKNAKDKIEKFLNNDKDMLKNEFETFTAELKLKQSTSEYDEIDIDEWKKKLDALKKQIQKSSKETGIQVEYQKINWDDKIISVYITNNNEQTVGLSHSIRINNYFNGTTLLSNEQQQHLNEFYGKQNQQWKLLYKAARDGFLAKDFHSVCDGKQPTMTIIQEKDGGYLFGGFTNVSWTAPATVETHNDGTAFIFTLKNPHSLPPTKYSIRNSRAPAVFHSYDFGPSCGLQDKWSDFFCSDNHANLINFPRSYIDTTGFKNKTFTGNRNFTPSEIEIFTLG